MTAICPGCRRPIPTEDLNVATDVALCRACGLAHRLSGLMQAEEIAKEVDFARPPAGTWYRHQGLTSVIGASHRSLASAVAMLLVCLFWNGIVSVFVILALGSTVHLLGLPVPAWFPEPKMNGRDMGVGITLGLWAFLTPFILIGLVMAIAFLSALGGRTEVTMQGGAGVLFGGIGPLGRRRRFQAKHVKSVRLEDRPWRDRNGNSRGSRQIVIELQEGKPLKFGSGLPEDRMKFVAAALRKELRV